MHRGHKHNHSHIVLIVAASSVVTIAISSIIFMALLFPQESREIVIYPGGIPQTEKIELPSEAKEAGAVFTDIFSSTGAIDVEKTTMHQNLLTDAFTFPPKFRWEAASVNSALFGSQNGAESVCIGERCLIVRDNNVYLDRASSEELLHPAEVSNKNLQRISLGRLQTKWTVGFIYQEGDKYRGHVFTFDGSRFREVLGGDDGRLDSDSLGYLAMGGEDNDWLVLLSDSSGKVYQIKSHVIDVSHVVNARVMNSGIVEPKITYVRNVSGGKTWWMTSKTEGNPKLVKFFENGTGIIQGAVDYSNSLGFSAETVRADFVSDPSDRTAFFANIASPLGSETRRFDDQGFEKAADKFYIYSLDLLSRRSVEYTREITITDFLASSSGGSIDLYISPNGTDWIPAKLNIPVDVSKFKGKKVLWRADVEPLGGEYDSVFIKKIQLKYYYREAMTNTNDDL